MSKERITFENDAGERLGGDLYWPADDPVAFVLFAHCFTCTARAKSAVTIARALGRAGFAVLTFDFTGLGDSGGDFAETTFASNVSDLVEAARFLESRHRGPAVLVGHSLGGTAALEAAREIDSCRAVVTIGAPATAAHVAHLFDERRAEIEAEGEALVSIAERPFRLRKEFLDDLERHDTLGELRSLRRALLVMHSPADDVVPIEHAAELYQAALHPKSFVSLDDADHLLSESRDAEYAAAVLAAWAAHYLDVDGARPDDGAARAAATRVTAETPSDGFATSIAIGRHGLTADEPESAGGSDAGPSPYQLLAAALASCTSMTLVMYARHKGLDLDEATVRVEHRRIHGEDCSDCETREVRIDRFDRELVLRGRLDDGARRRLVEIADRCPVHRTLTGEISIRTRLAGE